MSTRKRLPRYQVYLLRCWEEQSASVGGDWRFSLENPQTNHRQGFADLSSLLTFLQTEFAQPVPVGDPGRG